MTSHFVPWDPGVRLANKWTDVFRADPAVHFGIIGSIAAACFQGWLKDRIGGVLPYALSDGFFVFAFMWWLATRAFRRDALLVTPRGPMQITLLLVTLLPAMYLAVPGTPFFIQAELPFDSDNSENKFQRLMVSQDTGGAIRGPGNRIA